MFRACAFIVLLAAALSAALPVRADTAQENAADWRPTLGFFSNLAEEANARLNGQRIQVTETIARYRKDFALIENLRQQVILSQITAEDPWDYRDALRGIRQLREEIAAMTRTPFAAKDKVESILKRLQTLEADILAQDKRTDASEEFIQGLTGFREKIDALRSNAESLDKELIAALAPASRMLESLDREAAALKAKTAEQWKSYYAQRYASFFEMTGLDNFTQQWELWKTAYVYLLESIDQPESARGFGKAMAGGAALAFFSMACFGGVIAWIRRKGLLRTSSAGLLRAAALFSASFWLGYVAERAPFQYYTFFSAADEILFAAALTSLALFLDNQNSGGNRPRPTFLWPLWGLFLLGFVIQALRFPYYLAEAILVPSLLLTGVAFLRRLTRFKPEQTIDQGLARALTALFFALALCALAGYPQLSILLTSILFYVVLSVRFSLAIFRLATEFNPADKTRRAPLFWALLSGVGFPLIFLILLIFFLWLVSIQFGGESVFFDFFSKEFRYESFAISLGRLLIILAGFYIVKMLAALSRALILDMRERAPAMDKGAAASLMAITKYFWWGVYLLCVLFFLGFSPTSLAVVAGGLSVGIGFGLQNIVNNFISGLILLFGRSVQAGDVIELGNVLGVVKEVNIRNTEVRTFDNATLFTPNSDLISNRITNWSHRDASVRRDINVGVAYGSDLDLVRSLLIQAALESPYVLRDPRPNALFWDFGASSLDFKLRLWIDSIMNGAQTLSDVRDAVDRLFREHNVEIPFPQNDVHIKNAPCPPAREAQADASPAEDDGENAASAPPSPEQTLP